MILPEFIEALFNDGRIRLESRLGITAEERTVAADLLRHYNALVQKQLPTPSPKYVPDVTLKTSEFLLKAATLVVHREFGEDEVRETFAEQPEVSTDPSIHFSVDLLLQFGKSLLKMAREASPADLLTTELTATLDRWPLSAVGIEDCQPPMLHSIFEHTGLRRIYLDRIVSRQDKRAAKNPDLRAALKADCGGWPNLIPWLESE